MFRPVWALGVIAACALPASAQVAPDKMLATMKAAEGLKVELFASEPMLVNPTAIDVDAKGRVWVAEAVNYRRKNFNRPILRTEGDRIVVLTDTDGDGKADTSNVFYQGPELYGPLSVLVLPLPGAKSPDAARVLVAQSPDILEFTDADGDGKADGPPAKFLSGFLGFDHDHGVHGLTTGPDGKLYFTVGDQGVKDFGSKDGKGTRWTTKQKGDCQAGTVWRCDLDGNNVELIAHNFRNNYEATVDSFGEIWLSDNDDDGNQQTRICHVMPGGNYGYWPRGAGQSHWHEEQPGVVHKTLRTGFGSPTGIAFYEGSLLPKLAGQILHCDAGPREVRAFQRKPKGAGYELDKTVLLTSTDNWFRPSDVCVAPDGSVFVADWYDPGVGGHGMGDHTRGRVYRLTPKAHAGYKVPAVKLDTKDGVLAALGSPATSVRAAAQAAVRAMSLLDASVTQMMGIVSEDRVTLARALQTIPSQPVTEADASKVGGAVPKELVERLEKTGARLELDKQMTALRLRAVPGNPRAARYLDSEVVATAKSEVKSAAPDPQVFREVLLLLPKMVRPDDANRTFYILAKLYDGKDLFYRAALNIACGTDPARRDAMLADFDKQFPEWNDTVADLVWELRPKVMLPKLGALMADPKLSAAQKARIVDILAASDEAGAGATMLSLVTGDQPAEVKARALDNLRLFLPTKWAAVAKSAEMTAAVETLLKSDKTAVGLQLAAVTGSGEWVPVVAAIATNKAAAVELRREAVRTLGKLRTAESVAALAAVSGAAGDPVAADATRASAELITGNDAVSKAALESLQRQLLRASESPELTRVTLSSLAGTRAGTGWLLAQKQAGKLPEALTADAGRLLRNSPFQGERNKAMLLFPAPGKLDPKKLPSSGALATRQGDAGNGRKLMLASANSELQCLKCHMVAGQGGQIGPDLSLIGKKGSKENLFDSLIHPSKAIADQHVQWTIDTEDGQTLSGLIVGETETTFTLRDANGKDTQLPVKGTERKKSLVSLMPEGLVAAMTEDELVDLVAYLMTLQTASLTPDSWRVTGPFAAENDAALDKVPSTPKPAGLVRTGANGYVDLAAFHGDKAPHSLSILEKTLESPLDQEVTLLVGTDDGCRLSVNGGLVLRHDRHDAATPGRDRVTVKLRKGDNAVRLVVGNGNNPHGFYFTVDGGADVRAK